MSQKRQGYQDRGHVSAADVVVFYVVGSLSRPYGKKDQYTEVEQRNEDFNGHPSALF